MSIVHEKIMEITEGKTKKAQEKLDNVIKKWEKTRSTITQLQVAIKTAERFVVINNDCLTLVTLYCSTV